MLYARFITTNTPNFIFLLVPAKSTGAGEGNRTLVISLEGFSSTIELHPRDHFNSAHFTSTVTAISCFFLHFSYFLLLPKMVERAGFEPAYS